MMTLVLAAGSTLAAGGDPIEEPAAILDLARVAVLSCSWIGPVPPSSVRWVASDNTFRRRAKDLEVVLQAAGCAGEAAAVSALSGTPIQPDEVLFHAYDMCAAGAHAASLVVSCQVRAVFYGATAAGIYPKGNWQWLMSHPDVVRGAAESLPPADAELIRSYVLPKFESSDE